MPTHHGVGASLNMRELVPLCRSLGDYERLNMDETRRKDERKRMVSREDRCVKGKAGASPIGDRRSELKNRTLLRGNHGYTTESTVDTVYFYDFSLIILL